MRSTSRLRLTVMMFVAVPLLFLSGASARGAESLITNGDFLKWSDGIPDGWKVDIGAKNGAESPKSEVKPIKGPALMLRGDASTMAWHSVSQKLAVDPGGGYRLEFESRTRDVRREGRQFDNCYVGIMFQDSTGKSMPPKSDDVSADADWTKHRIDFVVPQNAETTEVLVFLSKTGILGVKNVAVTKIDRAALLVNGDFSSWTDGRPDGWTLDIGAMNGGRSPTSEVSRLDDPGLSLRGNASTMAWYSVSQEVPLRKGGRYRLEFQARSSNVRQEGPQRYTNCYVGVLISDANGDVIGRPPIKDLSQPSTGWRRHQIPFTMPRNAAKSEVTIFLSNSGTLAVKNLKLSQ